MKNAGKPIFDPFSKAQSAQQEVGIGAPAAPAERHQWEVHRACGHCGGNGKRKDDKTPGLAKDGEQKCPQCLLNKSLRNKMATDKGVVVVWGRPVRLFAFEMTDAEIRHLEPNDQIIARVELSQHEEGRRTARILCEQEEEAQRPQVVLRVRHFA